MVNRIVFRLRQAEKLPVTASLLQFGPSIKDEVVYCWQLHRPFWTGDWALDKIVDVPFALENPWDDELFARWLRCYSDSPSRQLGISCVWRTSDDRDRHIGCLTLSRMVADLEKRTLEDVPGNYQLEVEYRSASLPSTELAPFLATEIAGESARAAANGVGFGAYLKESGDAAGFEVDLPEQLKSAGCKASSRRMPNERFAVPVVMKRPFQSSLDCDKSFEGTLQKLLAIRGRPSAMLMQAFPAQQSIAGYIDWMSQVSSTWTSWSFLGRYKKNHDPFARPPLEPGEVRVYPLLEHHDAHGGKPLTSLFARVSVIHAHSQSFLELQTTEGEEWVKRIEVWSEEPFKIWQGPPELRWNLYPVI